MRRHHPAVRLDRNQVQPDRFSFGPVEVNREDLAHGHFSGELAVLLVTQVQDYLVATFSSSIGVDIPHELHVGMLSLLLQVADGGEDFWELQGEVQLGFPDERTVLLNLLPPSLILHHLRFSIGFGHFLGRTV